MKEVERKKRREGGREEIRTEEKGEEEMIW